MTNGDRLFDPTKPLTIESVEESAPGRWTFTLASDEVVARLTYIVEEIPGKPFRLFNPDPETRRLLGRELDALAGQTFAGPVLRCLREGQPLDLPIHLPCWWQGGNTPGWADW
jgi:hypothetical protein